MKTNSNQEKRIATLLWSIAFPGFGQLINKKYLKAILFVVLEVIINVRGNVNDIIVKSYLLEMNQAVGDANYPWLLVDPCVYLFAIWDAYHDAGGSMHPFIFIPFVMSAYSGTLGVIYSSRFAVFGFLIGPVFLPI